MSMFGGVILASIGRITEKQIVCGDPRKPGNVLQYELPLIIEHGTFFQVCKQGEPSTINI